MVTYAIEKSRWAISGDGVKVIYRERERENRYNRHTFKVSIV